MLSVIAYLVYLRWKVKVLAVADDKRMWTTGDYAVLLRNLKDGLDADKPESERITADALRELVFADLAELGFAREKIVQVEVGRACADELKLIKKLEKANIQRHELAARKLYRETKKGAKIEKKEAKRRASVSSGQLATNTRSGPASAMSANALRGGNERNEAK